MFNFLTPMPDAVSRDAAFTNRQNLGYLWQTKPLLATLLAGTLLLSACQQPANLTSEDNASQTSEQTVEQQRLEASKPAPQSDSAAARIAQFQPLYVTQMQGLQRRLQAEYESLQAADASDSDTISLLNGATESAEIASSSNINSNTTADTDNVNPAAIEQINDTSTNAVATTDTDVDMASDNSATEANVEINTSTEVGERDLEVLKRISLEPREPELLDEEQIIERYQKALQALYQPAVETLSAQQTDTLLNIAILVPELFEHAEIAERVTIKSPALGRLIVQHQVWQQIEVQQALDMQQLKQTQQQEFESLVTKFDDTIKGYDEQIANYEQTLKEFRDDSK